jgi:RNA polymerase sigma factor (sigma-70 family)
LRAVCGNAAADQGDGQLLERFLGQRDEEAFAILVQRHGPMVLGVCRRILGNVHDADDAFQATFLVLVQKARGLSSRAVLGDWLHGVARNTACNARVAAARRRAKEQAALPRTAPAPDPRNDWLALLDDELARLPEKYRLPLVLCDLEGWKLHEAAVHLSWPPGTVAGRLARGRALLAKRLLRGAQFLSAGLATALTAGTTQAAPAALASATVRAAVLVACGKPAAQVSPTVLTLARGVTRAMFWKKTKIVVLPLLLLLTATAGGVTMRLAAKEGPPSQLPAAGQAPATPPNGPAPINTKGQDAMPPPPFQDRPKDLKLSSLKIDLEPAAKVARTKYGLSLRLTITNSSSEPIVMKLAHEWHGGEWPPTDLYAFAMPAGRDGTRAFLPAYMIGEKPGEAAAKTTLEPGKSLAVDLRMDWPGTGSVLATPLIDPAASGRYNLRLALAFEAGGTPQYVVGPVKVVELPPPPPEPVEVRTISLKGFVPGKLTKRGTEPTGIANAEELAKAIPDKAWQEKIAAQVDFAKEYLVFFAWGGSSGDRVTYWVDSSKDGPVVDFFFSPGPDPDYREHLHLYVLPRAATWSVTQGPAGLRAKAQADVKSMTEHLARSVVPGQKQPLRPSLDLTLLKEFLREAAQDDAVRLAAVNLARHYAKPADMQRTPDPGVDYHRLAHERLRFAWEVLIAAGVLRQGMKVEEAVAVLGEPTRTKQPERADWYYDSPMHVNPGLSCGTKEGVIESIKIGNR